MPKGIYQRTDKARKNMSIAHLGHKLTDEIRKKISLSHKGLGHKHSLKSKEKMSKSKMGNIPWNKGISQPWSEARRKVQPPKKPRIMNGKQYHPNWDKIRKNIYLRDKWICQECGCKCEDKANPHTKKLIQCHHIDFNEKNNESSNLITLCASCHGKTRFNKNSWIKYYQSKIERIFSNAQPNQQ